jgi:hypothetical protein
MPRDVLVMGNSSSSSTLRLARLDTKRQISSSVAVSRAPLVDARTCHVRRLLETQRAQLGTILRELRDEHVIEQRRVREVELRQVRAAAAQELERGALLQPGPVREQDLVAALQQRAVLFEVDAVCVSFELSAPLVQVEDHALHGREVLDRLVLEHGARQQLEVRRLRAEGVVLECRGVGEYDLLVVGIGLDRLVELVHGQVEQSLLREGIGLLEGLQVQQVRLGQRHERHLPRLEQDLLHVWQHEGELGLVLLQHALGIARQLDAAQLFNALEQRQPAHRLELV